MLEALWNMYLIMIIEERRKYRLATKKTKKEMEKLKYQIIPKFSALKHHQASVHSQSCSVGQARRGWCISAPQCLVSLAGGFVSTLLTITASD